MELEKLTLTKHCELRSPAAHPASVVTHSSREPGGRGRATRPVAWKSLLTNSRQSEDCLTSLPEVKGTDEAAANTRKSTMFDTARRSRCGEKKMDKKPHKKVPPQRTVYGPQQRTQWTELCHPLPRGTNAPLGLIKRSNSLRRRKRRQDSACVHLLRRAASAGMSANHRHARGAAGSPPLRAQAGASSPLTPRRGA